MKITAISIIIAAVLIGGTIIFSSSNNSNTETEFATNNVSVVNGKQIITINAKGNYSPRVTTAKAGIPTIIKMNTRGTFDCTSALAIPSLGYRNNLPPSGETRIDVPPQKSGATIRGMCAMGMYSFTLSFK